MSRILLVDDDEMFRDAVKKNLTSEGHDVITAENGKIADDLLQKDSGFHLVISDIRMPLMDGIALTKAIRARSKIPLILVTGFSELLETQEAYRLGANEFLPKPFRREELMEAIDRCLNEIPIQEHTEDIADFCKLGIDDFVTGRKISFNVFIRITGEKFIKVAHKGEDLSHDRIRFYREKGLSFLYLRVEDFRKYVSFGLELTGVVKTTDSVTKTKKLHLLRHTGEILNEQIRHDGVDENIYESASAFVGASLQILTEDTQAVELFLALRDHADHLLAHSVGVSLYSVMIAQRMNWNMPTNRFKVAIGGLLHDVGQKEVARTVLIRPRYSWSQVEVQNFETHPIRGMSLLNDLKAIPEDVREIVKQHHENCLSRGYPARLKKTNIHPMAKLISVADEFCYRIVKNPDSISMPPQDAIQEMALQCSQQLDKTFFEALVSLFRGQPQPNAPSNLQ